MAANASNNSESSATGESELESVQGDDVEKTDRLLAQLGLSHHGNWDDGVVFYARLVGLPHVRDDVDNLWLIKVYFGLILSQLVIAEVKSVLVEYKDCFTLSYADLERTPYMKFAINLRGGSRLVRCGHQRRFVPKELAFMREKIDALSKSGLVEKWEGEVEWLSEVTLPPKKNSDLRICYTFVALNRAMLPDPFPLR